jgi:hypothetical protein
MKPRAILVWVVTMMTPGSGVVSLVSVMGLGLPDRRAVLREFFPVVFHYCRRRLPSVCNRLRVHLVIADDHPQSAPHLHSDLNRRVVSTE